MPSDQVPVPIEAEAQQPFLIELASTPGAGLVWRVQSQSTGVELAGEDRAPSTLIGGQTLQRFRFVANAPGTYQLRFELKRPWEADVRGEAAYEVHVR